jgi:hypothetical protein
MTDRLIDISEQAARLSVRLDHSSSAGSDMP